jgi:hypothetical protein
MHRLNIKIVFRQPKFSSGEKSTLPSSEGLLKTSVLKMGSGNETNSEMLVPTFWDDFKKYLPLLTRSQILCF